MDEGLTVAVTGADGFVGRHLVRELLTRGHRVRALARDMKKAAAVLPTGEGGLLTLVPGDVTDDASVAELLTGADACAHLVGIIREGWGGTGGGKTFERDHVAGTRVVVRGCERAGVRRLLHMSALGARPDGKAAYQRTKYRAEEIVRDSGEGGLVWTIFRPSLIHGPDGEFVQLIAKMAAGEVAPFVFMPYFVRPKVDTRVPLGAMSWEPASVQPISVLDVAWCFAESLQRSQTEYEIYNLVGPEAIDWRDLYLLFRDELPGADSKIQPWHIPGHHAAVIANLAQRIGLGPALPFDAGQALMAMEDTTAELEKLRAHFGLAEGRLRRLRETVREYAPAV
jgi:NADH dehydrogenase